MSQPFEEPQNSPPAEKANAGAEPPSRSGLLYVLVLLVAAVVLAAIVYFDPLGHGRYSPSRPTLTSLNLEPLASGTPTLTLADVKGKVVLLNFWGTWCGPCRVEFPEIVALERQYRGRSDVLILPVSCGPPPGEDTEAQMPELRVQTQAFLDQRGVDLPVYFDPSFRTRLAVESLGMLQGYPTTILLDGQQRIFRHWPGRVLKSQCEEAIELLLQRG